MELVFHLADGRLIELAHGLALGFFVDLLQFALEHRATLRKLIVEEFLEDLVGILHGLLALVLADVAPTGLNARHGARIDRVNVAFRQVVEHLAVQWLAVELLGLDAVHDLAAQSVHLLHELGSQVVERDVSQILELVFLGKRPNHGAAIALFEEALQQPPDSVLLIDGLTEAFLCLEGLLQVVFRGDRLGICID